MIKKCSAKDCKCIRPVFGRNKSTKDGLQGFCKECRSIRRKLAHIPASTKIIGTRACKNPNCSKEFGYTTKNEKSKLFHSMKCKDKYYWDLKIKKAGGIFAFSSHKRASNKIKSKSAENRYKHYSESDLLLIQGDLSSLEISQRLNRSPQAIQKKRHTIKQALTLNTDRVEDFSYGGMNFDEY